LGTRLVLWQCGQTMCWVIGDVCKLKQGGNQSI
jgi:hypothetical protein